MLLNYKKKLEKNLKYSLLVVAFKNFLFFTAIIVPFFKGLNFTFLEIFIIESAFALTVTLTELPSGYFADKFGRKKAMFLGSLFGFLGMIIFYFSNNFLLFILAEILAGLSSSFISGSDSAIIYDSLKELKKIELYKKIEGKKETYRTIAIAFGAISSGFLASISIRLPFLLTAITALIAILFSLKLTETKHNKKIINDKFFKLFKETVKTKDIFLMILFSSLIFGLSNLHYLISQNFLEIINLSLIYFGLIFALANLCVATLSLISYKIEEKLGLIYSMIIAGLLIGLSYIILGNFLTTIGIIGIFTYQFARGIRTPIVRNYINSRIPSSRRATIMSFDSFIGRGLFVLISPIVGFYLMKESFSIVNTTFGVIIILIFILIILLFKKVKTD